MFELASGYKEHGMLAYSYLQENEFAREGDGYRAVKHQKFVGTDTLTAGAGNLGAERLRPSLKGSTEEEQFVET